MSLCIIQTGIFSGLNLESQCGRTWEVLRGIVAKEQSLNEFLQNRLRWSEENTTGDLLIQINAWDR